MVRPGPFERCNKYTTPRPRKSQADALANKQAMILTARIEFIVPGGCTADNMTAKLESSVVFNRRGSLFFYFPPLLTLIPFSIPQAFTIVTRNTISVNETALGFNTTELRDVQQCYIHSPFSELTFSRAKQYPRAK